MVQQKTQDWGRGGGFLKTKCESSSHFRQFLPLVISGRRLGIKLWLWGWGNGCAIGSQGQGDTRHSHESWLHQVLFVFLTLRQLPIYLAQRIANGIELRVIDIFALWMQHWEIDCTLKETPKDLNAQSSKCMNSPFV